ncbi:hypothetical protein LEP1GSC024_0294, partial [Leptospira noguchii str. 2001034031]
EGDTSFFSHLGEVFELLTGLKNESKRVEIFLKTVFCIYLM